MNKIRDAILADQLDAIAGMEVPKSYRAVLVRKDEQDMFEGLPAKEKDPRKALHVEEVATPELGPGEVIVAVMASAVNYNTVWTSVSAGCPRSGSSSATAGSPSSPSATMSHLASPAGKSGSDERAAPAASPVSQYQTTH